MKKIALICEKNPSPVQRRGIALLSAELLERTGAYPVCLPYDTAGALSDYTCIYVGTAKNPTLARLCPSLPQREQEYRIFVHNGTAVIAGGDDAGVLYGCADFFDKYLVRNEYTGISQPYYINLFENTLPDFDLTSAPAVKHRGIWTWGHVIYDFRGLIDNMVRLKLNTLTVWNDHLPFNAEELVAYAHDAGVKVIWGFSWLWDTDFSNLNEEKIRAATDAVLQKYDCEYKNAGGDGIYFQSFTEVEREEINGIPVARTVTDFVNRTAALLLEKAPELELQFGLHATSVKHKLEFIRQVDPRIRIVWENCGAFPFSYLPSDTEDFDGTLAFVKEIASLRGAEERFGAVTKGLTKLDWGSFEHPTGAMCIGNTTDTWAENRILRKRKIWKLLQAYWLTNADRAQKTVRLMADETRGELYVTPLVEDGMFERQILFPVALCAEMLWDAHADARLLTREVALRPYVEFA